MPPTPTPHRRSRARVIGFSVAAALAAVFALGALSAGGVLVWASAKADDDGFINAGEETVSTRGYAVTTGRVDLDLGDAGSFLDDIGSGEVKLAADAGGGAGTFVGIARSADVRRYLQGSGRAVITDYEGWPGEPVYREQGGDRRPQRPAAQEFWVAETQGPGRQELTWDVRDGDWTAVVMHADASKGLDAEVDAGAELPGYVGGAGFGAIGVGILLLGGSVLMLWLGLRRPGGGVDGTWPAGPATPSEPTAPVGPSDPSAPFAPSPVSNEAPTAVIGPEVRPGL